MADAAGDGRYEDLGVRDIGAESVEGRRVTPPLPIAARGGPVSHAIFRLARLHRLLAGQLLRRVGLHPNQELLMMHLWDTGTQRQADLVAVLESDSATITRSIQRLERAGFVRRRPHPDDRRATLVEPTPAGQALRRQVEQVWDDLESRTLRGMSAEERSTALGVLRQLEDNLVDVADPDPHRQAGQ